MTPFQQITAGRREQRRYEKRAIERALAVQARVYRAQLEANAFFASIRAAEVAAPESQPLVFPPHEVH